MQPLMIPVGEEDDRSVPHWALLPEDEWAYFESFPEFLKLVWSHLRLPQPTRAQLEIAQRLQYGYDSSEDPRDIEKREDIIRAFRGIGKSYVTGSFAIWRLARNPRDEKILVVSATGSKAKEFVSFTKSLINTMDLLEFLRPRDENRNQADRFDVNGASISQSFSLKAAGIDGQITGSRATLIIADDIEIVQNSMTEEARQRLLNKVSEFEAIKMPGADVIFLGTPQTEESIYNRLVAERQYTCFCIPARYPRADKFNAYLLKTETGHEVNILAPFLINDFETGKITYWSPTDPERFDNEELNSREAKGRSFFALQYQLDTSLSDAERYPLRQHDLMVFECNPLKAPMTVQWGLHNDRKNVLQGIPNLGFSGDHLLRPLFVSDEWRDYESTIIYVDPSSGRGNDEFAWAVMKSLNGMLYLLKVGTVLEGMEKAFTELAMDAKRFNVSVVEFEPNTGGEMLTMSFQPILQKIWPGGCTVRLSEWATRQKETRIIDTLEPVLTQHRLVVNESFLKEDASVSDRNYSLLYQLTHITRERGCLTHDDRLDAVAGAVASFTRDMGMDVDEAAKAMKEAEMEEEIQDFLEALESGGLGSGRMRGKRRGGQRTEVYRTGSW